MQREAVASREITAQLVPSGEPTLIAAGSRLLVTQALGGNFTVMTERGYLARVQGKDADALGEEVPELNILEDEAGEPKTLEDRVLATLKTVYDPEIPVDIVELGLIYRCEVKGTRLEVDMTLTAPGCGMSDIIKAEIEQKLAALEGVAEVDVQVVFEPPWDPSRMSDAARLETGFF